MQLRILFSEIPFNYCVFNSAKYSSLVNSLVSSGDLFGQNSELGDFFVFPVERKSEVGYHLPATLIQLLQYQKTNLFHNFKIVFLRSEVSSESYWIPSCQQPTFFIL